MVKVYIFISDEVWNCDEIFPFLGVLRRNCECNSGNTHIYRSYYIHLTVVYQCHKVFNSRELAAWMCALCGVYLDEDECASVKGWGTSLFQYFYRYIYNDIWATAIQCEETTTKSDKNKSNIQYKCTNCSNRTFLQSAFLFIFWGRMEEKSRVCWRIGWSFLLPAPNDG